MNHTCYRSYREIDPQLLKPKKDSLAIRMLLRLIVLHQYGQLSKNHWKAIWALESHRKLMKQSKDLDLAAINADIRLLREVTKCDISEDDLQELYWQINVNRHSVESPLQPPLGSCLVPSATLINHSCDSNTHHFSEGPELVFRSSRKIAKNEEIVISYIVPTQSFEERHKALRKTYAFDCQCRKCIKGIKEFLAGNSVFDPQIHKAKSELRALFDAFAHGTQELDGIETRSEKSVGKLGSLGQ